MIFKNSKLRGATVNNDTKRMEELVAAGADINHDDHYDGSIVYLAATQGRANALRFLLDKGAAIADQRHGLAFMMVTVVEKNHIEVARMLLAAKPELAEAPDLYGNTPLHVAASKAHEEMARLLLDGRPALAKIANSQGETPLHAAAVAGHADMVALLLDNGAEPGARTKENRTALFLAQKQNFGEVADLLRPVTPSVRCKTCPDAVEGADDWKKLSGERIARVSVEDAIGYRITEIFNFSSRERTTLFQNMETKAETADTRTFDEIEDKSLLQQALSELRKRGGAADGAALDGFGKKRLAP